MNCSAHNSNDTIEYSNGTNLTFTKENFGLQIVELYLPLAFRPVFMIIVIYLALSAIDAILTTRRRHTQRFDSIEFFFLINLLISDIVTVVAINVVSLSVILNTLINPDTKGVKCYIIAASRSPSCGTSLFVTLVCFDRMMFFTNHDCYVRFMTKKKRYIVVSIVWLLTAIGNVLIVFDPTLEVMSTNGICIHRPLIYHYKIIVVILPALVSVIMAIIQNVYVFHVVFQSNAEQDRHMSVSGMTANDPSRQRRRPSHFIRVLRMSRRSAFTAVLLASAHFIFGAAFPLIEYFVCPRNDGSLLYVVLTSVVFVVFDFVNLMIHPLLYGFYVQLIRQNLRHRELCLCLYQICCCRLYLLYHAD